MPDRREGITRAAGFGYARIDMQTNQYEVYYLTKISFFFSPILKTVTEAINRGKYGFNPVNTALAQLIRF